jgi:cytochrome c-type protein NapC
LLSAASANFTKQTQRAAEMHRRYLVSGEATCIDCDKGIAHELPEGMEPGWRVPPELRGRPLPQAAVEELKAFLADASQQETR